MTPGLLRIGAAGLNFAYLAAGPEDGPLALCLHGFPDTAHTYRHLMPQLAAAGFRAVAPFSRGYAPTDIPDDSLYQTGAPKRPTAPPCSRPTAGGRWWLWPFRWAQRWPAGSSATTRSESRSTCTSSRPRS